MHLETQEQALTIEQEFSIEIPDKEADAIHSGMFRMTEPRCNSMQLANFLLQSPRQSSTSLTSPMVCCVLNGLHSTTTNTDTAH